ncbi:MAG: alpha/beta hydrolase, partial [Ruminococcus sp.]|nr:alpha/beta hydrolase [Candidatus Copronaster equi]
LYNLGPEDISIKSVDNLNMYAWFVPAEKETKRFVICVHGWNCNGPDEMSHIMPFYHYELGCNYLLPDLTGHGRSEGSRAGFGSFDAKNILLWIDYLINRFGEDIEIILHGISMGAATVMNVNEMSPPNQIKLIIEDCGFVGAAEIIGKETKEKIGFTPRITMKLASAVCKVKAGYFFSESAPLKNMYRAKNPILFIHGTEDTFVPFEHGKKLYEACPVAKDYLWVDGAIHAFSYYNAKEEYENKIKDFISKYMDVKETANV